MRQATADGTAAADIADELDSFTIHLRAENKSASTVVTYSKAVMQLDDFLAAAGMPRAVAHVHREHVEAYLISLQDKGMKPATVSQRFRSLQQSFKWLASEGVIKASPMANMKPPHVPETPPPVLTDAEIDKLIGTTAGTDFADRRDRAILMLFMDTGMRRGELSGLRVEDVDFDHMVALVVGTGRGPRACPFGNRTAKALSTYIKRARKAHPEAHSEWLWLGKRGRLAETGVEQVVSRRGAEAGMPGLHPHLFRHTFRTPVARVRRQ